MPPTDRFFMSAGVFRLSISNMNQGKAVELVCDFTMVQRNRPLLFLFCLAKSLFPVLLSDGFDPSFKFF
jgi:hypothetical protein